MNKLDTLVSDSGYNDVEEMLEDVMFDSTCMGICMEEGCDYSTEVEPDQCEGYCEVCGSQTVTSVIELALF